MTLEVVRTTLSLDDDVLVKARELAHETGKSLGTVISELARQSLTTRTTPATSRNGIQLLPVGNDASAATLQEVNRLSDELP